MKYSSGKQLYQNLIHAKEIKNNRAYRRMSLLVGRLEGDCAHDQRNEFGNFVVNALLVQLIHQHDDDG